MACNHPPPPPGYACRCPKTPGLFGLDRPDYKLTDPNVRVEAPPLTLGALEEVAGLEPGYLARLITERSYWQALQSNPDLARCERECCK